MALVYGTEGKGEKREISCPPEILSPEGTTIAGAAFLKELFDGACGQNRARIRLLPQPSTDMADGSRRTPGFYYAAVQRDVEDDGWQR